jgi:hypothetical protein
MVNLDNGHPKGNSLLTIKEKYIWNGENSILTNKKQTKPVDGCMKHPILKIDKLTENGIMLILELYII